MELNSVPRNPGKSLEQHTLSLDRGKVSIVRESVSDSGVQEAKKSLSELKKRGSLKSLGNKSQDQDADSNSFGSNETKIPRKFITTWRMACDKTKDRTKELLKRWRTLPEGSVDTPTSPPPNAVPLEQNNWSVHVWATWVKRYSIEDENLMLQGSEPSSVVNNLSQIQKEKLSHMFSYLLDMDRDNLISKQDFEAFTEKLRHFADWSNNCDEYLILQQVQQGFMQTFLQPPISESEPAQVDIDKQYLSSEQWLQRWSTLITGAHNLEDFPIWLQYFPKVMFHAINKSGSRRISRDELSAFFSSMLGYSNQKVEEILDDAFKAMTANGDHPIKYQVYRLCFANFLLARHPNGPGQYMFGSVGKKLDYFPVDYSALNSSPEDREHYSPGKKSNRVSVIV